MSLKGRYDQLAEREKKLLLVFGALFGGGLLILLPLFLRMSVSAESERNQAIREAIDQILEEREALANRKEEQGRVEARYARKAPALAGFLAQTAEQSGIQIPETQDRAVVPHGKTVKERQTRIKLNKVGMLALSNFLEKIAQSGYAVAVTRLDLQKRGGKPDEFDAEMDVSAFDREAVKKPIKEAATPDVSGDNAEEKDSE